MANSRNRRPSICHPLAEQIAAAQLAFRWIDEHMPTMLRIARAARAPLQAVTGPAFDEVESLILSGDDPVENIGLIVDAVARELRPRGPTFDPSMLESHGGATQPMDILTAMIFDAPEVTGADTDDDDVPPLEQQPTPAQVAKEAAAAVAALIDRGQNHRDPAHRQKEKAAAAREHGQLHFCGLDWRAPASNDDDDFDGLEPQGV